MRVVLLLSMLSFLSFRMPTQPNMTWLNSSIGWLSEKVDLSLSRPDLSCLDKGQLDVNGSVITITNLKIKNTGFSDASVSYVGYYLSTDKNFTTDDVFLGHDYVDGLAQRESSTENFMIDLSGMDIPEGEYYVGTVIDYMGSVDEGNEDNNNDCFWDAPKVVIGGKANLSCKGNGELTIDGLNIKIGWVSVINNGTASAGASKVGFYLSTNQTFSTSDIFLGSREVEALDAGEFVMIPSFEKDLETLGLEPGTYYIGFIIDYEDDVMESNENDNNDCSYEEVVVIDEIPSGDPNLACKERGTLDIDEDRATINGLKIRNYGDATSTAGQVGIYLSDDTNFTTDDLLIKTRSLNALEPGQEQMYLAVSIDLSIYDLDPDTYYIGIIVDDTNETAESNENDNASCFWDEPTYKVEEGDANLACKARGELIIDNETGDLYIGWTTVGNYGDAPAGESQIGFYASSDNVFDEDDVLIATRDIEALGPEESAMIEEINTNTSELGLNPGLYFVIAVIDHNDDVEESNEEDNDDCFWDEPKIYIPNSDVDLTCKTLGELIIDNDDKSYYIGWTTIINNGSTTAPASEIGFYVSTDTEFSDDDVLFASQETDAIEAGGTYMIDEIEGVLDVDLPAGTYNVIVVIDHENAVAETNEENNDDCFWQEPRFFIPAAEPDLACKALGELIIDNDDLSYYIGWTTVINNGDGKAGASKIGFYVSTDATLSDDDKLFASQEIDMLEPGESHMIDEIEDVLDIDLASGTYQVLVKIDYLNEVEESNEANNADCYWDEPRFYIPEENRAPNLTCKDRGYLTVNGANISISGLKVTNNGDDFAGVSRVGIYLSENQFFSSSDILVGTVNIPKLSPGQIFNVNFNKDLSALGLDSGDYFVGVIVDKDNQVDELDETDNNGCSWTSPKVEMIPAKPNLTCAGRGELVITNHTQLKFSWLKVKNNGDAEAGASKIGFYLSTDANITTGDIFLGSKSIGSIDPGETITPSAFNKDISGLNLADGTYYAGFILDYNKQVMESNENDNNDCKYDNKVIIDNAKANLVCDSKGEVDVDGKKVKISWFKVKNTGDKKSPASKIGFYLSTDTHFTTDDYFIGSRSIDALNPGGVDLISALEVDVAGLNIPYGTYHIGAYIDYTYIVEEYSETDNNDCYFSTKVTIPQPKPNLVCHDRGELQIDGNDVHISWSKVKNAGDGYSESTKVGFYLSKDTHFSTGDKLLGTTTLPKLAPGEVKLLSAFNKDISDLNLDPGKYYVGILIDPYNTVAETNESDNNDCYWTNPYINIQPPKPNLTCMSRGEISAYGSTITISWSKVKNDGGSTAAPSYVGYYLSKDTHFTTSDKRIGTRYIGSIPAGGVKTVDAISINLSSLDLDPGEYFIGFIIDYKNEVYESNENDNNDCYYTSPKVIVHPPKPNLTCKSKGEINVDGSEINLSWAKIMNSGGSTAGAHKVGYYLSTDQHFTTSDYYLGEAYISSLDAGEVATLPAFHVDAADKNIPSGYYYFGFIIDYKYHVTESDEYDNNDCFYDYPKVHIPAANPDLKCKDLGEISVNGDQIHISWSKVMNRGDGRSASTRVGYYLSKNTTIKPNEDVFLGSRPVPALDAGDFATIDAFNADLSNFNLSAGTYYIGYYIDDKYNVSEAIEENNTCYWTNPKITIEHAKPNLTLKYGSGGLNVNGSKLHFSNIKVVNNGGANAGESKVGYYLSTDGNINPSHDIYLGEDHVSSLSPGQHSTEGAEIDLSALNIAAGTYYVGFYIDYKYQVHESDETDNGFKFNTRINVADQSNKPDLTCLSSGTLQVIGADNDRVRIEGLQVRNIGGKKAPASTIGFYLSKDKNFTEEDYFVGTRDVNALNPGKTATLTFEEDIPDAYPPAGKYYLGFILDYDKRISEENEVNNNDCYFNNPKVTVPERDNDGNGDGGQNYCVCSNYTERTFCESFDEYDSGMLGPQSNCWTTWSGDLSGYEDGVVENSNGNNYMKIKAPVSNEKQDVVLRLGDRTSGKYRLDFKMWLFNDHRGYYNLLHTFAPGADLPDHAFEVYFMGDGTGYVKAAGRQHNFSYPTFEWFDVQQEFDIDNDVASVTINGVKIASWMFSSKPNHNRSFSRRLAAMNYYPADNKNQFYIDNVRLNKVDSFDDEDAIENRDDEILPPPLMEEEELTTLPSFNMSYYPNPASSELTVEFNVEEASDVRIELYNSIGQMVLRYEEDGVQLVRHQFDITNQAAGLYYIKAWAGDQQITRPVVITK